MSILTDRFDQAVAFAREVHHGQYRKGTRVPYLSHPMGVASLVLEYEGDEDEAIAGLLHDVLEDGGAHLAPVIETRFGARVLTMVRECSDAVPQKGEAKPPWKERKLAYIASLEHKTRSALLVTACDKLHNLTAMVRDYRRHGDALWTRFTASAEETRWYYGEMATRLEALKAPPAPDLRTRLAALDRLMRN